MKGSEVGFIAGRTGEKIAFSGGNSEEIFDHRMEQVVRHLPIHGPREPVRSSNVITDGSWNPKVVARIILPRSKICGKHLAERVLYARSSAL